MFYKTESEITINWQQNSLLPLVSIICITYNHEKYIAQALNGFLMQETHFPFEILIGEDCSTDATRFILQEYQNKYPNLIKLITSELNVGPSQNFKRLFEPSTSKYIALCEGDDYWTASNKLEKQIAFLEKYPEYTMCCHNSTNYDQETNQISQIFPNIPNEKDFLLNDLFKKNIVNTCTVVYRNLGIKITEMFDLLPMGDWPLHMLHAEFGKIKYFPEIMAVYRIHGKGIWTSSDQLHRLESAITMLQYMKNYFNNSYSNEINHSIGNHLLAQAMYCQTSHDYFKADQYFKEAAKYINKKSFLRTRNLIKKVLYHLKSILSKWIFNE